jgi:hypothetical protein
VSLLHGQAQGGQESKLPETIYPHAIAVEPLLPFFNSFSFSYERKKGMQNGLIAGFWYSRSTETYPKEIRFPGYSDNYSLIIACRRYFWKNLHAEYQVYPGYTRFYEEITTSTFHSFSLFNEFRVGYKFEFLVLKKPVFLNLQWPVGFTLYESNEPDSFREIRKQDPVFYILFPNIYLGFRF